MTEQDTPQEVARRCTVCGISYPHDPKWSKCAQCGESTDIIGNAKPTVTDAEATSLLNHRKFNEYLEKEGKT